jgi:methionine biosynthesis protein MetW
MPSDGQRYGFLDAAPDALRYDFQSYEPDSTAMRVGSFIAEGSRVLDVGCGTGTLTASIKDSFALEIIGIEPNAERAAAARNRGLSIFQEPLSEKFFAAHGLFDFIIFADVLEHLANPDEMVFVARKGLRPGGSLIVSVPNVAHWFVRLDLLRGRFEYRETGIMDATHLRWFTRDALLAWLGRLGFEITGFTTTVNIDLPEYGERLPWKYLSRPFKTRLVRTLARRFPALFACQYVVKATPAEATRQ